MKTAIIGAVVAALHASSALADDVTLENRCTDLSFSNFEETIKRTYYKGSCIIYSVYPDAEAYQVYHETNPKLHKGFLVTISREPGVMGWEAYAEEVKYSLDPDSKLPMFDIIKEFKVSESDSYRFINSIPYLNLILQLHLDRELKQL